MASRRMTANPKKAPRYRAGKPIAEDVSSSDSENEAEADVQSSAPTAHVPPPSTSVASNQKKAIIAERKRPTEDEEAARAEAEKIRQIEAEGGFVTEESEEESDAKSESESDDEESEDNSSADEAPRRLLMKPIFIKKNKRNEPESLQRGEDVKQAEEEARRQQAANELVEEQIRRDLAAKAAGKRNWDDDEDDVDDVDDTDDVDPEAEHAAWKLRELRRIKREREAIEARERELEELERRKNLTEEERRAEDAAFLAEQKEEREGRGKMSYLQKYYHKGAFFQDSSEAQDLSKRDIMGSRYADDVQSRELLPQALQIRDMTKIGKKGATKYRDLKTEDTGRFGNFDDRPLRQNGPFTTDERFMSDRDRERAGIGVTGANDTPMGKRGTDGAAAVARGQLSDDNKSQARNELSESDPSYSRGTMRERSPRRKRSTAQDLDRHDMDKRRKLEG